VEEEDLPDEAIDHALRANRLQIGIVPTDNQQALARQRRGQARIRQLTVENYRSCCAVCDIVELPLLIASHIVGWAEAPEHRGDLANVICLCRIRDMLFEAGYWSLDDSLRLVKRDSVSSKTIRLLLDAMTYFERPRDYVPDERFLTRHRKLAGLA
jgi:predicted restriction endonuclease